MDKKRAEMENAPVAKFLRCEAQVSKLCKDVEKLISISTQHGTRIRELFQSSTNSVSQVEFMAAITTTRFQQLNIVKSMKETAKTTEEETAGVLDFDNETKESKDTKVLKQQITNLESEIFNSNFKYNIEIKKLEHELKVSRKEQTELRKQLNNVDNKLYSVIYNMKEAGVPEAVELVNTHTTLVEIVDSDVERSRANTMHIITDAEALDIDGTLIAGDSPKRNSQGELEEHSSISELMETVRNTLTPSAEYKHSSVGFADDVHSPQHSSSEQEQAAQKTPLIADTRDDFRRSIYKRSPTMMQQSREEEYVHRGPVYKKKVDDPATAYVHRDSTDLGSNPKQPYFGAHYSGRPSSPPHPIQPQPYQTQGLETPGSAARRTSNPALFAVGRSPSFRQTYNVNTNTGYNTASHPPIDFYYEQFMALRDLVLASLPNRDAPVVAPADQTQGGQQVVLQSLSVPPTYDYLDTLVTSDSLRQYQKATTSKSDSAEDTKEKGTVGLCSTVMNYLASQQIPVEKQKEEDEGDSEDENDTDNKPSTAAVDKTALPTVPILLDCRVLNRQLYTNVNTVKDVRAIAQAVALSSMYDAVNTYESAAYGKFKSNLLHSSFPTNKINSDTQSSVAIQTDGNHSSSRDGKRSRKQSVVSQQQMFSSDPSSGLQTPEQIAFQQNAFSQALLSSVEEMERPAQSFSGGGGHNKRGSMGSGKPSKKGSVSGNNKILQALKVVNEQFNKDGPDPLVENNEPVASGPTSEAVAASSAAPDPSTGSTMAAVATVVTTAQKPNNRKRSIAENKKASFLASSADPSAAKEISFAAPARKQSISIQQFDMKSFGAALNGGSGVGVPESTTPQQSLQIPLQIATTVPKERVGSIISVPPLVASPPAHMSRKSSINPQPPGSQPQPPMTFNSASFSLNQQYQSIELTPEQSASMHSENGAVLEDEETTHAELAELFAKLSPKSKTGATTPRTVVIPSPKPDRHLNDSPSLESYGSILLPSELSMMAGYESSVNSLNPSPFHDNNYIASSSNNNNHNHLQQSSMHSIDGNDEDDEDDRYHASSVYTAATGQSSGGQTHSMEAILSEVMKIFDRKMEHQKAKTDRRFKALEGNSNGISAHVNKILHTMKQMNVAARSQHDATVRADASIKKLGESVSGVEQRMQQETVAPLQNNITSCLEHIVQLEKSIADQDKQIELMQFKLLSDIKTPKAAPKKDMFLKTNVGSSDFNIESTHAVSNVDLDFVSAVQDVTLLADTFAAEQQLTAEKHTAREELGRSLLGEQQRKSLPDYDVDIVLHQLKEYASLYKTLVDTQTRHNRHPDVPSSIVAVSVSPSRLRNAGEVTSPTRPRTPTRPLTRREVVDIIESDAQLIGGNIEIVCMKNDIAILKKQFAGHVAAGGTNTNFTSNTKHFIEFPVDMPELSGAVTGSPTSRLPGEPSNITKGKKANALKTKIKVPIAGILPVIPLTQQPRTERGPRPILTDSFNTVNLEGDENDDEMDQRQGDAFFGEEAVVDTLVQTSGILTVGLDEASVSAGNSVINVDIRRTPNRSTRGVDSAGSSGGVERSENYMSPPKTAEQNLRVQLQPQPHQPATPVAVKSRPQVPLGLKSAPRVALAISAEALLEQRLMEGGSTAGGSMTIPENLGPHVNMLAPTPPSQSNKNNKRNFAPHRSDGTSQQQQPSYLKETSARQPHAVDPQRRSDLHSSTHGPVYLLTPNSMRVVAPSISSQANVAKNNAVWQTDFKKQNQLQPAPHSRDNNQAHEEDSFSIDSREASDKYYQDYTQAISTGGGGEYRKDVFSPPTGTARGRTGGR